MDSGQNFQIYSIIYGFLAKYLVFLGQNLVMIFAKLFEDFWAKFLGIFKKQKFGWSNLRESVFYHLGQIYGILDQFSGVFKPNFRVLDQILKDILIHNFELLGQFKRSGFGLNFYKSLRPKWIF